MGVFTSRENICFQPLKKPSVKQLVPQGSTLNIHPYLSAMVNYTCPMKFQVFKAPPKLFYKA